MLLPVFFHGRISGVLQVFKGAMQSTSGLGVYANVCDLGVDNLTHSTLQPELPLCLSVHSTAVTGFLRLVTWADKPLRERNPKTQT